MLIIASSRSEKSSELLNLIKKQYVYVKDINESKYQYLIKKRENSGLENMKNPKALIEYSNNMQNFHKNIKEHSASIKYNVFFDDMITDKLSNEDK